MAKTNLGSFLNKFISLFILLLHLGCFVFTATKPIKKRKPLSSTLSFLKRIFSSSSKANYKSTIKINQTSETKPVLIPPRETHLSDSESTGTHPRHQIKFGSCPESEISSDYPFFPLRNDIFPCTACGEIFQKSHFLEQHQATKHDVSELINDVDSGNNIVRIIFKTGYTDKVKTPEIHRIFKIHNISKILMRFEDYIELVKAKAIRNDAVVRRDRDERCIADGNELPRFNCSIFMCDLGLKGNSSICNQQYCSVCGIIKSGFSSKMDGISNELESAHGDPEDVEEEFKFMNVKRT